MVPLVSALTPTKLVRALAKIRGASSHQGDRFLFVYLTSCLSTPGEAFAGPERRIDTAPIMADLLPLFRREFAREPAASSLKSMPAVFARRFQKRCPAYIGARRARWILGEDNGSTSRYRLEKGRCWIAVLGRECLLGGSSATSSGLVRTCPLDHPKI